ncbi:hypothetical protein JCM17844_04310 [Iodidimonas gelatinilytica]|uniref:TadE-like domain-containing protein n=3 Tax=Iodidimonas gelatinilytica TaxID=1236966 RepID=A0A5A7MMB1_9PROT|nr:hypothetical protein JCM17844_04310 [Iodidimonas gelatinilytica]
MDMTMMHMPDIKRFCREFVDRWSRDRNGAAIVEFALAFPIVIGLTMGIVEMGHIAFANATLEGSVREASRRGVTGFAPDSSSREDYVRGRVIELMEKFSLDGPVEISTQTYDSFGDIGEPEPFVDDNANGSYDVGECFSDINQNGQWDSDMGMAGLGGAGAIVVYTADVNLRLLTPAFAWFTGSQNGSVRLSASTAVRNEPFSLVQQNNAAGAPTICS